MKNFVNVRFHFLVFCGVCAFLLTAQGAFAQSQMTLADILKDSSGNTVYSPPKNVEAAFGSLHAVIEAVRTRQGGGGTPPTNPTNPPGGGGPISGISGVLDGASFSQANDATFLILMNNMVARIDTAVTDAGGITSSAGQNVFNRLVQVAAAPVYGAMMESSWHSNRQFADRFTQSACLTYRALGAAQVVALKNQKEGGRYCGFSVVYADQFTKESKNAILGYKESTPLNFMAGVEARLFGNFNLAIATGYGFVQHDTGDSFMRNSSAHEYTKGDGHRVHVGATLAYQDTDAISGEGLRLVGGGSTSYTRYSMERRLGAVSYGEDIGFDSNLYNIGVHGRASYGFRTAENFFFEPRFAIDSISVFLRSEGEHGSPNSEDYRLNVRDTDYSFVTISGAISMAQRFYSFKGFIDAFADVGYSYLLSEDNFETQASFVLDESNSIVRYRNEVDNMFIDYTLGFNWSMNGNIVSRVSYEGMVAPDGNSFRHGGKIKFTY